LFFSAFSAAPATKYVQQPRLRAVAMLHPIAKVFSAKLIKFGQIWLDLGEIWAKLRRFLSKSD